MTVERTDPTAQPTETIRHITSAPPIELPIGYLGPVVLPGSGRLIWWTGRVAIGLRHQPVQHVDAPSQSALWLQDLLLQKEAA